MHVRVTVTMGSATDVSGGYLAEWWRKSCGQGKPGLPRPPLKRALYTAVIAFLGLLVRRRRLCWPYKIA